MFSADYFDVVKLNVNFLLSNPKNGYFVNFYVITNQLFKY